jgi:antitoxin (DNA-binding transcriptional repressor) of toxin-antitoxin stability system
LRLWEFVHIFRSNEDSPMPQSGPQAPSTRRVGVREFRDNLTSFLKQIEDGQRFVLTSNHKVVAEIGPPSKGTAVRKPGALRGKIKVAGRLRQLAGRRAELDGRRGVRLLLDTHALLWWLTMT